MSASLNKKGLWRPQDRWKADSSKWVDGTSPLGLNSPGCWGQRGASGGVVYRLDSVQQRLSHLVGGRWMFVNRGTQRGQRGM